MNPKVISAVNQIVELLQSDDIGAKIAIATYPPYDVPCSKWSLPNQLLCLIAGTYDARGFRQWKAAGRFVKKGSHAFRILIPRIVKTVDMESREEHLSLAGFLTAPVFAASDTDGADLPDYEPPELPKHRLMDVAARFNVSIDSIPYQNHIMGHYSEGMFGKRIRLASPDEIVFWHELAHAAHHRIAPSDYASRTTNQRELIADLTAASIGALFGEKLTTARKLKDHLNNHSKNPGKEALCLIKIVGVLMHGIINNTSEVAAA
ncbi:antirestriction protein [bacterium]|nr:antirestriction protein [bacterium]